MFVYAIYDHPFEFDASTSCGSSIFFLGRRRLSSPNSSNPALLSSHRAYLRLHDPETAGDPQFDYGVDDPSLPEQPDAGAQEPDAAVDDDSYYPGGAYYYVQAADDDHE